MRQFYLLFSLLCILALAACGTEEDLTPPAFSNVMVNGDTVMSIPFKDPNVTITGNIDDFSATIVANSTVTGEVPVVVNSSDGSWSFPFAPQEGANLISFIASDKRGNLNQMILTLVHDPTPPLVTAVSQSTDPSLQLVVTFDETLADLQPTAVFAVDGNSVSGATLDTVLTHRIFTLPLSAVLTPGSHQLTCDGIVDLAGNSVAVGYFFDFTIE